MKHVIFTEATVTSETASTPPKKRRWKSKCPFSSWKYVENEGVGTNFHNFEACNCHMLPLTTWTDCCHAAGVQHLVVAMLSVRSLPRVWRLPLALHSAKPFWEGFQQRTSSFAKVTVEFTLPLWIQAGDLEDVFRCDMSICSCVQATKAPALPEPD